MNVSLFDAQEMVLAGVNGVYIEDDDNTWDAVPSEDVIDSEITIPLKATPTDGSKSQWFEVTIKKVQS